MKFFGTDGIRGHFGSEFISEKFFNILARAFENFICQQTRRKNFKILVGHDTRISAKVLKKAFFSGFSKHVTILDCGVIPTPAVSLNTITQKANYGFSITASHNPYSDNGIKIFNQFGEKLSIADEQQLETLIELEQKSKNKLESKSSIYDFHQEAVDNYVRTIIKTAENLNLHNYNILLDCANGATYETSPAVLKTLGANVKTLNNLPDGTNINLNCGSEYAYNLSPAHHQCDIAIAHDGDGDRVVFVDQKDNKLDGDKLLGLLAKYFSNNTVVTTEQSNLGLDQYLQSINKEVVRSSVGDRNVFYLMKENSSNFGGENSGHVIFHNHLPTGDGLLAAIKLLSILQSSQQNLQNLTKDILLFNQSTFNINIAKKISFDSIPELLQDLDNLRGKMGNDGRILTRYSGTEPKLRLLVEAKTQELTNDIMGKLQKIITRHLNNFII